VTFGLVVVIALAVLFDYINGFHTGQLDRHLGGDLAPTSTRSGPWRSLHRLSLVLRSPTIAACRREAITTQAVVGAASPGRPPGT
jgi:hypothetical protein